MKRLIVEAANGAWRKPWAWAGMAYLVLYLPSHAVLSVVESSIRAGTLEYASDLGFHLGAWVVFLGLWLFFLGVTAVPLVHFSAKAIWGKVDRRTFLLLLSALCPFLLLLNSLVFDLLTSLPNPDPTRSSWVFTTLPGAFVFSGVLYGWVVGRKWVAQEPITDQARGWLVGAATPYAALGAIMLTYAVILPTVVPQFAYRIAGPGVRMDLEMRVLENVSVGTPVIEIEQKLPGFFSEPVLQGGTFERHAGNFRDYGYRIRVERGVVIQIDMLTQD